MSEPRIRRRVVRPAAGQARARAPKAAAPGWNGWNAPWWLAPVLALAAGLVLQARSLGEPFFADDWLFLDVVRSRSLLGALMARDPIGNFFRPLGRAAWWWTLSHASGESPLVFHAANLLLWLASVVLLWALVRRVAGARAAAVAAAIVALTHAADVPVRWCSGSQDLLAVTLALAAMLAFVRGRHVLAAVFFFLAPLAKEIVALSVIPAALLARRRGEPWSATAQRAWPALAATAAWLAVAALAAMRHHGGSALTFSASAPLAAIVDAARTLFGIEWATGNSESPPLWMPATLAALALAVAAVGASRPAPAPARTEADGADAPARGDVVLAALAWLAVGALPVAFVTPIWSAYFYLFAISGAALLAGTWLADAPAVTAMLVVLALGGAARRAGNLHEFATESGGFTPQSHVNDFYIGRGVSVVERAVGDLKRLHPHPEPNTTFFFTGVPSFAGVQVADGPLVRSVYRDSSLRSYFLTDLSRERMRRGPAWFMFYSPDSGHFAEQSGDPNLFVRVALGHILNGRDASAREAIELALARPNTGRVAWYLAGFMALQAGERDEAARCFTQAGYRAGTHGDEALRVSDARAAAGDTTGAIIALTNGLEADVLDPRLHARIVDLKLTQGAGGAANAALEAYVQRVLAPDDGLAWRRWAYLLYWQSRMAQSRDALERYYRLAPAAASADADAAQLRQLLPRLMPGGDLLQHGLAKEASR